MKRGLINENSSKHVFATFQNTQNHSVEDSLEERISMTQNQITKLIPSGRANFEAPKDMQIKPKEVHRMSTVARTNRL